MSGLRPPREWDQRCERIARSAAGNIYYPGADHDDVVQEARIGVWKSLRDWRPGMGSTWASFAALCAQRQVITGLKSATRVKHQPLSDSLTTDRVRDEVDGSVVQMRSFTSRLDPLLVLLAREDARVVAAAWRSLTLLEREVLVRCRIGGESYTAVGLHKQVDNAMQRGERKLRRALVFADLVSDTGVRAA